MGKHSDEVFPILYQFDVAKTEELFRAAVKQNVALQLIERVGNGGYGSGRDAVTALKSMVVMLVADNQDWRDALEIERRTIYVRPPTGRSTLISPLGVDLPPGETLEITLP